MVGKNLIVWQYKLSARYPYFSKTKAMTHKTLILCTVLMCHVLVTSAAMSAQMVENSKKLMKSMCINKSGVSSEALATIKSGEFADDKKLKCYMNCCLTYMKVMKKDKISYEQGLKQIEGQLPPELRPPLLRALNTCKDVDGPDGCEIAYQYVTCAYKDNPSRRAVPY